MIVPQAEYTKERAIYVLEQALAIAGEFSPELAFQFLHAHEVTQAFIYVRRRFGENAVQMEPLHTKDIQEIVLYWRGVYTKCLNLLKEF